MKHWFLFLIALIASFSCIAQNTFEAKFDPMVLKLNNGVYDTVSIFQNTEIDTVYITNSNGDTIGMNIDTNTYNALNICIGDTIQLSCYGLYNGVQNHTTDLTALVTWDFGDGTSLINATSTQLITYPKVGCYDITAYMIIDSNTSVPATVKVRIADIPIKKVFDLASICSTDSLLLNISYGNDATIQLKTIKFTESVTKEYAVKTFIPDGMNQCPSNCFTADVNFSEFPQGRTIRSADDICSICINMEHSYMGDYRLSISCPSGKTAVLKYGKKGSGSTCDPLCPSDAPEGSYGGGGQYVGIPYGGANDYTYDNINSNYCDSVNNMYGEGLDYCFSRNGSYTLASGRSADVNPLTTDDYIASTNSNYTVRYTDHPFITIPSPYINAGRTADNSSFSTKRPSDHENKSDYYAPAEDFDSLIGCPLNGNWQIQVCDFWPADNGWIFSWNMDICGVTDDNCKYTVGLDTVIWEADDHLNFNYKDSLNAYISADDTAGTFPLYMNMYDEFGCIWRDTMPINIVQTPEPILDSNISICSYDTIKLTVGDKHPQYRNTYSYEWSPTGDKSDYTEVYGNSGQIKTYIVQTTNTQFDTKCSARDTTQVIIKNSPIIAFDLPSYPLEGCEPFKLDISNKSKHVHTIRWDFGDGKYSTDVSPVHYYNEGTYSLKCYATSIEGCTSSASYDNLVTVFSSPKAEFSWEPTFPSVTNPSIQFINKTTGNNPTYRWEVEYDKDYPYSFHTLTEENPTFKWEVNGRDIAGDYTSRLIAFTNNMGPSGNFTICSDTLENRIHIINDMLEFPNVVTPNGDGLNDMFIIKNLVSSGYHINELTIYNKWGVTVYHATNIVNVTAFWDPNVTNSPAGTYFYKFKAKGYNGNVERTGVIEVIR